MKLLRIQEAAAALGVCQETLRRWVRRGWIPAVKVNSRVIRVRSDDLEKLIASKLH